ncbi:MAG TPA: GNAT family N-acetyltransferase [Methylophilaceae bacterium]|nr:GNAT family N-acetyltransferase [Methylophilaceae bacterium]
MNKPNNPARFLIREVSWQQAQAELREIRSCVFVEEQLVPAHLEWDGYDENAIHLLALSSAGHAIGCARILEKGTIGRMAVLKNYRGQGVGCTLLEQAIQCCRERGWNSITLSAQTHAISFYERTGFVISSDEYMDAEIPHRDMQLKLSI